MSIALQYSATMQIPSTEPTVILAGDTLVWQKSFDDYPASAGWSLTYTVINGSNKYTISAGTSGDLFSINVAASVTATYAAGDYNYFGKVKKGAEEYTVTQGSLTIKANPATATTLDSRSDAKVILAALKQQYKQYVQNGSSHVLEYQIAGRQMRFRTSAEILEQINYWQAQVVIEDRAERIAKGLGGRTSIKVRLK